MDKALLMIAFRLPPSATSSGHLRPLAFAKHLPTVGWEPIILTANKRAYTHIDPTSLSLIPKGCRVHRAFALDARRHLGIRGKYPSVLAQPDRWAAWWPAAVCLGLRLIRRHQVQAIWSTYPIMTAHCIAYTLSGLTGLPWIADFRDPVASSAADRDRRTTSTQIHWEHRVLSRAKYSVFTTPGAMRSYAKRYPKLQGDGRLKMIPNGFDEADFVALPSYRLPQGERPLHLVHAGVLYPSGRSPIPFFKALASLRDSGFLADQDLRVTLRACGSEKQYGAELERLGLNEIVSLAPSVPYHEALAEQAQADALLLFQGAQFDSQIPSKLYEYLRIGRPIFALVGEDGDTAALLRDTGGAALVSLDDAAAIERSFSDFVRALREQRAPRADANVVQRYSRHHGAVLLAKSLDEIVG